MSRPFTKPAMTIAQQMGHLAAQGMAIPDAAAAEYWLRHVSYYRLSAYWLPFEKPKGQPGPGFVNGTSFDAVIALYEFDRRLRLLLMSTHPIAAASCRGAGVQAAISSAACC